MTPLRADAAADAGRRCRPCASRRRGQALESAIYAAALGQLRAHGYGALTMEGVAAAARTGKAALYRRWAEKSDLVVDAIQASLPDFGPPPDSGNVRDDLVEMLSRQVALINSPPGCALQLVFADSARDETMARLARLIKERVLAPRKAAFKAVLKRGVERGQVDPSALTPLVVEAGPAVLMHRYMAQGGPVPRSLITHVVDDVVMPLVRART